MEELKTVPYGMTLRELLRSCSFDGIAEEVRKDEHQADCVEGYREAYNILLNMEGSSEHTYDIEVKLYEGEDAKEPLLYAKHLEGNSWEWYIDGDIYTVDTVPFTKEHLAYRILWHLTFYGFSPEEQKEAWLRAMRDTGYGTEYGKKAALIERKRHMLFANDRIRKAIIESVKWFKEVHEDDEIESFALPEEDWNYIRSHRQHCNRMKRMRDHRLKLQAEKFWELDKQTYLANKKKKYEEKNGLSV